MCDCTFKESPWRLYHQSFAFDDAFSFLCEEKKSWARRNCCQCGFSGFREKIPDSKNNYSVNQLRGYGHEF